MTKRGNVTLRRSFYQAFKGQVYSKQVTPSHLQLMTLLCPIQAVRVWIAHSYQSKSQHLPLLEIWGHNSWLVSPFQVSISIMELEMV